MKKALFIGQYPNTLDPYLRSFFQALIYAVADSGIECTVIAPVSITHYKRKISKICYYTTEKTNNGNTIKVYHPKYISYSSKKIGGINTGFYSEKSFQRAAIKCSMRLKEHFDFVYGHFFLTGGLAAVRIGKIRGIPSFIAYGECDYESQVRSDYGDIKREELDGLTGIISVSSKNTKELNDIGIAKGFPVITAPNSTDLKLFFKKDKAACREKLGLPQNKFIVGFVGGFIERKGDKRLLEAVNQIDGAYVAFAGRGDNPPSGDKVVFCKSLEHELVSDFLNAIDVFCLPTLSEGSCNAIVEAMACGAPIISSNLPFNDDALNESNSIRIDPTSVEEIKNAIYYLMVNDSERVRLQEASLSTAQGLAIESRTDRILKFVNTFTKKDANYDSK
jgi:glycosyltransferase involved in cell wall biosynthesis